MEVVTVNPSIVKPSPHHVRRTHSQPKDDFVRSVKNVGIINAPIGTIKEDSIHLIDGVRRAKAAEIVGVDQIPILVEKDLSKSEAISKSITLNSRSGTANNKTVTSSDRSKAINRLEDMTGVSEDVWKQHIGLISEADRIEAALEPVFGVGPETARTIAKEYSLEELKNGNPRLQAIDGIGKKTAKAIHRHLRSSR